MWQCLPDLSPCADDDHCCSGNCALWTPHKDLSPRMVCLPQGLPPTDAGLHRRRLAADDGMPHGHRPCKHAEAACTEHSECCSWLCVADFHGVKTCLPIPM